MRVWPEERDERGDTVGELEVHEGDLELEDFENEGGSTGWETIQA